MHTYSLTVATCVALVSLALTASADLEFTDYGGGLYVGYITMDSDDARDEGIDDQGILAGFRIDSVINRHYVLNAGLGLFYADDEDPFRQTVRQENLFFDDDISTESSDIEGISAFLEAGVRFPVGFEDRLRLGVNVGYHFIDAERTISNCSDCRDEDVDVDAGLYLSPAVIAVIQAFKLDLSYQYYFDQGGARGAWIASLSYMFGPDQRPPIDGGGNEW